MLHSKLQNLSEKYKTLKSTYSIKQIYRQKESPTVLNNLILLKRYTYVQFNELLIKNTLVKRWDHFCFYGEVSPASYTKLIKRRQSLSLQSNFISLNKKLILHFLQKIKTEAVAQTCPVKRCSYKVKFL